jgi:actin-related protein 4
VIPTQYGIVSKEDSQPQYFFGDNALHNPFSRLDVKNPISSDGIVEDWDLAARVWEYCITSRLTGQKSSDTTNNGLNNQEDGNEDVQMQDSEEAVKLLQDNPLLLTEPGWSPTKAREKCLEIAMEDWGCPAFWLGRSGVLAA